MPRSADRSVFGSVCIAAVGLAVMLGIGGCRDPLLTADEPRSQFHQYDVVRDQQIQPFVRDEFGRQVPNLRGRLLRPD